MTQLSDDCFAVDGPLLSVEDAVALIGQRVPAVAGRETVPLALADGRVSAETVLAGIDLPGFDNAAVDGYAVRARDLQGGLETRLPVRGRVAAGRNPSGGPEPGAAVRIFTGAAMPAGFDTVFMQEDVRRDGEAVCLPPGLSPGANRRRAGEDIARGSVAIPAGRRLGPADLALAAALGRDGLSVRTPLRVALFSTGDEIAEAGAPLRPGQIHDSNRTMLASLLRRLGARVSDLGILRDEIDALGPRIAAAAADHDLVLTSGGVSVGEEDHVRQAVEAVGRLVFWRLAVKPGRPVAMGLIRGVPFVGLPGNPVAVYVTFLCLVRPLIARLAGETPRPATGLPVRSGFRYEKKAGRREYVRVSLRRAPDGVVEAVKFPRDGAALLTSLTESDGLAELPEAATGIVPGETVLYHPHGLLW